VDGVWVTKSEGVRLIVRAVSFQDFQSMWMRTSETLSQHVVQLRDLVSAQHQPLITPSHGCLHAVRRTGFFLRRPTRMEPTSWGSQICH